MIYQFYKLIHQYFILLEPEQEELLMTLVEADRNTPRVKRKKFIVFESLVVDTLLHPGMPKEKESIYVGDIEILANEGFLKLGYDPSGSLTFDINHLGFRYYEYLKAKLVNLF